MPDAYTIDGQKLPAPAGRHLLILASITFSAVLSGCKSPPKLPASDAVDNSWIIATKSCWPDLTRDGYNFEKIKQNLADPANFRSVFPTYSALSSADVESILTRTVGSAPPPDISKLTHSSTPVLTREQAAQGTSPQNAVVASTTGIAPPDALCAVQTGTPEGFR